MSSGRAVRGKLVRNDPGQLRLWSDENHHGEGTGGSWLRTWTFLAGTASRVLTVHVTRATPPPTPMSQPHLSQRLRGAQAPVMGEAGDTTEGPRSTTNTRVTH